MNKNMIILIGIILLWLLVIRPLSTSKQEEKTGAVKAIQDAANTVNVVTGNKGAAEVIADAANKANEVAEKKTYHKAVEQSKKLAAQTIQEEEFPLRTYTA